MRPSLFKHPASFRREQNIGQSRAMRADNRLRLAECFDLFLEAVPSSVPSLRPMSPVTVSISATAFSSSVYFIRVSSRVGPNSFKA